MSENTIRLQPGDTAPDFTLDSADGTPVTLSEVLKEHDRVVLYFYPAAMTPGCTTQA
ncbi:MAG TPA: redoxin domain-containing protein, partial [Thermobifida alba]|nr:redoxin domain-containing protein [Thermobifida alba]